MLRGVSMAVSSAGRAVRRHCVAAASPRLPPPPAVARDNVLAAPLDAHPDLHPAVRAALSLSNASQSQLSAARISAAVRQYQRSPSDTGSPEVQVAVMTERINALTAHLKLHRKDNNTVRSVVRLVHKRRGMMRYLLRECPERYLDLVRGLGLRETTVFSKDVGTLGAKNKPVPMLRRND